MDKHKLSNPWLGLALMGLGAWIAFNLVTLTSYPTPSFDDAFFSSIAYQFMQYHNFGFPLYGDMTGTASSVFHVGRLFIVGLSGLFYLLGVGLFQARLYSFLGGLVTIFFVYKLGSRLWGQVEGLLGASVLALSWQMFWSSHAVRPDTWIGAAGMASLHLFFDIRQKRQPLLTFLFGLLVALLLDLHLKTLLYLVTITILVVHNFGRSRDDAIHVVAFACGAGFSIAYWLCVHFLPDPLLMYQQWRAGPFAEVLQPKSNLAESFISFINVILNGTVAATRLGWLELGYFVIGIGFLLWRRSQADNHALAILALFAASYILLMPGKSAHHLMLFRPLLGLVVAAGLSAVCARLAYRYPWLERKHSFLTFIFAAPLLLGSAAGDAYLAWGNRVISFAKYSDRLAASIPEGANVLSEDTWWFRFYKGTFTSDFYLAKNASAFASDEQAALKFIGQVVVRRNVEFILIDERPGSWYAEVDSPLDRVYPYLAEYAEENCILTDTVQDYFYGVDQSRLAVKRTSIYQCH